MSNGVKMPRGYRQKQREARRERERALARIFGCLSRHDVDREGSQRWVETGRWEAKEL